MYFRRSEGIAITVLAIGCTLSKSDFSKLRVIPMSANLVIPSVLFCALWEVIVTMWHVPNRLSMTETPEEVRDTLSPPCPPIRTHKRQLLSWTDL